MTHIDSELLAAQAIEAGDWLTPDHEEHLAGCADCAAELAELRRLLAAADPTDDGDPIAAPPARLWAAIAADLGADELDPRSRDAAAAAGSRPDDSGPEQVVRPGRDSTGSRRRWTVAIAAALVGILVGVLGTIGIRALQGPPESVVAEIALDPLPGKAGAGQATLIDSGDGLQLRVALSDITVTDADLEVWLINTDGERMRSLGLAGGSGGSFAVPGWLLADDYRIVDVSVEPHDGNLAHSTDSEVRGTLP